MEKLQYNHLIYVMHNVLCWNRDRDVRRNSIKSIAYACYCYDASYDTKEYEYLIRKCGLRKLLKKI